MKRKKQFIAGAICPNCSEMDSLVIYPDDQSIACVSCDFEKSSEQRDSEEKTENNTFKNQNSINIKNLSN